MPLAVLVIVLVLVVIPVLLLRVIIDSDTIKLEIAAGELDR